MTPGRAVAHGTAWSAVLTAILTALFTGGFGVGDPALADATIQLIVPNEGAVVIADEIHARRSGAGLTHADGRRTVLLAHAPNASDRATQWDVWVDPAVYARPRLYADLADAFRASHASPVTRWTSHWAGFRDVNAIEGAIALTFDNPVGDPRWRFAVSPFDVSTTPLLWPPRTAVETLVVENADGLPLARNAVRIHANPDDGERAYAFFDLDVRGADAELLAWLVSVFTERAFTPLFPPRQIIANPSGPRSTPAPRPAAISSVAVSAGASAHPRTIARRADVLLRENGVHVVAAPEAADIHISIEVRVTFESDAFPFGHPERIDAPHTWTVLGLVYAVEFGEHIRGTASSPDLWVQQPAEER